MGKGPIAILRLEGAVAAAWLAHIGLEHFRAKWAPVRVKKMRQGKDLVHRSRPAGTDDVLDRALSHGLKSPGGLTYTHLGRIGHGAAAP